MDAIPLISHHSPNLHCLASRVYLATDVKITSVSQN